MRAYVRYVLPSATKGGSRCGPKTKAACETKRKLIESAYESVQHSVGTHHRPSGSTRISSLSRPSWTPLHADPESTKKRKRGGLRPQTTHVSASGRLGSQPRRAQGQHDPMRDGRQRRQPSAAAPTGVALALREKPADDYPRVISKVDLKEHRQHGACYCGGRVLLRWTPYHVAWAKLSRQPRRAVLRGAQAG